MINGLGGGSGFGENDYVRADDPMQSTGIDITGIFGASGVKFGSNFYTTLYINNNGMVTFGSGYSGFTPNGLSAGVNSGGGLLPAIALYWTDLDTRTVTVPVSAGGTSTGTNLVHWDVDTVNKKITITWDDVGEFSYGTTSKLAGQIILSDAGSGNMDIEFRYEYVVPLDSHTATAGWNVGVASGTAGVDYYEIPIASGTTSPNDVLADLDTRAGNTGLDGIWRFFLRDGSVLNADLSYSPTTFAESTANDGSISTVSTLTLVGDTFTGANGVMDVADYSVSNLPAGLTAVITKTSSTTATLTLTGNAAAHANANDINNLTVTFNNAAFVGNNASAIPGTTQNLIIDFAADSNHAPTALGDLTLAAVNEDTAAPAGAAISSLAGLAFTDVDGAGTLGGVAVVSNAADANTQGIWQYSTDAGAHWSIIGTVSGSEALALAASTLLRFVPVANYNGTPTGLTVHAMDDSANFFSSSGATESRVTVDASLSGGTTAIATATNTIGTSITAVNDAPVITGSGGSVVFTEGANVASTPVAVHTGLALTDIDNATLASATVSITGNFHSGEDVLVFTGSGATGNISGNFNSATGVLTLTSSGATATLAQWEAALDVVTYTDTSDTPATANRTVSFVVNDGTDNSNIATRTVVMHATNDLPVISSDGGGATAALNIVENTTAVTTVTATDADGDTLTFGITGGADAAKFTIDTSTGALAFAAAPSFGTPTDADGNNSYVVQVTTSDGHGGTDVQTITATVTSDGGDHDGVSSVVEDGVPGVPDANGTVNAGDGNGDGLADALQANVTSVPFRDTDQISQHSDASPTYVTIVADSNAGLPDTHDGNSATLEYIQQLDAPTDAPAGASFPLGVISFIADIGTNVTSETFSLFVSDEYTVNGYWKQASDGHWANIASAIEHVGHSWRIDFTITDGGEFDSDGTVNGLIVDPGAVGYLPRETASASELVTALYAAFYDRAPDASGLTYWVNELSSGSATIVDIARGFAEHQQFEQEYGGLSHAQIATQFYTNILGQSGDADGITYWTAQLDAGKPVYQVIAAFIESALNVDLNALLSSGQLSQTDYSVAYLRQTLLDSQVKAGLDFAQLFGTSSNPTADAAHLSGDAAYNAAIHVLDLVTSDPESAYALAEQMAQLVGTTDPMQAVLALG